MASFEPIREVDYHQREEIVGGRRKLVQLAVHEYTARHPFAREANRMYLTMEDVTPYGNVRNGLFVINESAGWALVDLARRTQQYLLACGNGITKDNLLTHRRPIPPRVNKRILRQLRMPHPKLFKPSFFRANPFQVHGPVTNAFRIQRNTTRGAPDRPRTHDPRPGPPPRPRRLDIHPGCTQVQRTFRIRKRRVRPSSALDLSYPHQLGIVD